MGRHCAVYPKAPMLGIIKALKRKNSKIHRRNRNYNLLVCKFRPIDSIIKFLGRPFSRSPHVKLDISGRPFRFRTIGPDFPIGRCLSCVLASIVAVIRDSVINRKYRETAAVYEMPYEKQLGHHPGRDSRFGGYRKPPPPTFL